MSLDRLQVEDLKEIADKEGIKLPTKQDKDSLVSALGLYLSATTIRKYVREYGLRKTEQETVITERTKRTEAKGEPTGIHISREKMILGLATNGVSRNVFEQILHQKKMPFIYKKNQVVTLSALPDSVISELYSAFCTFERDREGRFFEWRMAKYIQNKFKCDSIKMDIRILGADELQHEIDVAGYDEDEQLKVICECKARGGAPLREDILKWIRATVQVGNKNHGLDDSLFASTSPLTQDTITMIKNEAKGGQLTMAKGLGKLTNPYYVDIHVFEELQGTLKKVFP